MDIKNDHMFHGAALTQIAEHPQFTAINGVRIGKQLSRCAFRINDNIGVYLKYATKPKPPYQDYIFTFMSRHKGELRKLNHRCEQVFIALVCVEDRHVCCISYGEFTAWLERRRLAQGKDEDASTILISLPAGKAFRVNMNRPGRRKVYLGDPQLVPRNRFPNVLFE